MLHVRSVQAQLHHHRIKRSKDYLATSLRLCFFVIDKCNRANLILFVQVQRSLQAVFRYQNLQSVFAHEENVTELVLYLFSEKQLLRKNKTKNYVVISRYSKRYQI